MITKVLHPAHRMLAAFLVAAVAGCGGGDFPVEASGTEAPVAAPGTTALAAAAPAAPSATAASGSAPSAEVSLVIRRQPAALEVREGDAALFSIAAEGPRTITYQWLRDDEPIEGETGTVLKLTATPADHLARISVIVRAAGAMLHSDAALLRVSPA